MDVLVKGKVSLDDLEKRIRAIARRFSSNANETEDLEQIGRMTAWQVLESKKEVNASYVLKAVEFAFLNQKAADRAKKRGGGRKRVSFNRIDEEYRNDREFAPEDFLSVEGDITNREKIESIRDFLRNRFGRCYIHGMKKSRSNLPAKIIRGLVEEVWKLDFEQIPEEVDYQKFVDSGMSGFLWAFYRNSPMRAISDAYPGRFFEWQFNRVSNGFWDGEGGYKNAVDATRWLCQKKGFDGSGNSNVGYDDFSKEGLGSMLMLHFNHSPYLALRAVFPNLRPWRAQRVSNGFFDSSENQRIALDCLLQDLGIPSFSFLSPEEVYDYNPRQVRKNHFEERGLRGLLARHGNCVYDIFSRNYPGKTYPWFFHNYRGSNNPREMAAKAVKWLFEDYLQISKPDIPKYATQNFFWKAGFSGILSRRDLKLNSSPFAAVNLAYPGDFSREEFSPKREVRDFAGLKDFRGRYKRKNVFERI